MQRQLRLLIICSLLSLTSCSFLSPVAVTPPQKHMLTQTPNHCVVSKNPRGVILVSLPETQPIFNTTKMAYTNSTYTVAYFSQHEWAETPAQMLQPLIVKSLDASHLFRAIVIPPFPGQFDYSLQTQIVSLQQNFLHNPAVLNMTVRAQLVQTSNNKIIGSKVFTANVTMPRNSPEGGVYAANQATKMILGDIVRFCRDRLR